MLLRQAVAIALTWCVTVLTGVSAIAQPLEGPPAVARPISDAEKAERLLADVEALYIVRTLALSREQIQQVLPVLEQTQAQYGALEAELGLVWQANAAAIERAIADMVALRPPDLEAQRAATNAAAHAATLDNQLETAVANALQYLPALLLPQQAALLESIRQYQERIAAEAELGGASSVAEYIVRELDVQRYLMPDEYAALRIAHARQIASRLAPQGSPPFPAAVNAVLQIMDEAYSWDDARYGQERPNLAARVAAHLNLPPPPDPGLIPLDTIDAAVRSPRTPHILTRALGETPEGDPPARWQPHPFAAAMARSRVVGLLNRLRLTNDQLVALLPLVRAAAGAVERAQQTRMGLVRNAQATMDRLRAALLAGTAADPKDLKALADLDASLREAARSGRAEIAAIVAQLREVLAPDQAAIVDWQPPGDVLGLLDPEIRAAFEAERAAVVNTVLEYFAAQRFLIEPILTQTMTGRARDLAGRYLPRDSREFPMAVDLLIRATRAMRTIPDPEWEERQIEFAAQVAVDLGILEPQAGGAGAYAVGWEVLYDMLSEPSAPDLVSQMIRQRGGEVPEAESAPATEGAGGGPPWPWSRDRG